MLENLDTVDWQNLHHCYGEASDLPGLLRKLLSQDQDERELAFRILHETVWHSGSVFEASAYVIPFLVEMLESDETPDRVGVAFLLAMLTQGTSDLSAEVSDTDQWFKKTRETLRKWVHLLYPYLSHDDPSVRQYIARALAFYPERGQETLPLLHRVLQSEQDEFTRPDIQAAIAILENLACE